MNGTIFRNCRYKVWHYNNNFHLYIDKRMKTSPMLGMKQPIAVGCMMGTERFAVVCYNGKLVQNYKIIITSKNFKQSRITNQIGEAIDLNLPADISQFQFLIFGL